MNRKRHYIVLLVGITLLISGILVFNITEKYSTAKGGIYPTATKENDDYYLIDDNREKIFISKQEYYRQHIMGYGSFGLMATGSVVIFSFFILSTIYRNKYKEKYK